MTCQMQSRLVSLPGELRNEIFSLVLTTDAPIVNPYFEPSIRPKHKTSPPLGTALIRSCHSIHNEIDISPLYQRNTFVFTRISHIQAFRDRLTREQMRWIPSITIDLREAAPGEPNEERPDTADIISNEWLHYLNCNHHSHMPGIWCSKLSTLASDLPDLEELVVDLTGWQPPFAGSRKDGWRYLQRLLANMRGMNSITIRGKCLKSDCWNPRPSPWSVGPWFSPAFSHDDTGLLELLGSGVRDARPGEEKVFAWNTEGGTTSLQVSIISTKFEHLLQSPELAKNVPVKGTAAVGLLLSPEIFSIAEDPSKMR